MAFYKVFNLYIAYNFNVACHLTSTRSFLRYTEDSYLLLILSKYYVVTIDFFTVCVSFNIPLLRRTWVEYSSHYLCCIGLITTSINVAVDNFTRVYAKYLFGGVVDAKYGEVVVALD